MIRQEDQPEEDRLISARFFLWTIRRQDRITRCLTLNMWSAVSVVLGIAVVGLVTLEMALLIIFVAGIAVGSITWVLIERRRSWLLSISDPNLRAEAHRAMIDYLRKKFRSDSECREHLNGCDASPFA